MSIDNNHSTKITFYSMGVVKGCTTEIEDQCGLQSVVIALETCNKN